MKAVMLAAEIGARLGNSQALNLPKILLRFGDRSLLQRHIDILKRYGIGTDTRCPTDLRARDVWI